MRKGGGERGCCCCTLPLHPYHGLNAKRKILSEKRAIYIYIDIDILCKNSPRFFFGRGNRGWKLKLRIQYKRDDPHPSSSFYYVLPSHTHCYSFVSLYLYPSMREPRLHACLLTYLREGVNFKNVL